MSLASATFNYQFVILEKTTFWGKQWSVGKKRCVRRATNDLGEDLTVDVVVEVTGHVLVAPPLEDLREEEVRVRVSVGVVGEDDPPLARGQVRPGPDLRERCPPGQVSRSHQPGGEGGDQKLLELSVGLLVPDLLVPVHLPDDDLLSVPEEGLDVLHPLGHGVGLDDTVDQPEPLRSGGVEARPDVQEPDAPDQLVEEVLLLGEDSAGGPVVVPDPLVVPVGPGVVRAGQDQVAHRQLAERGPVVPHPAGLTLQAVGGDGGAVLPVPGHVVAEDAGPGEAHLLEGGVGDVAWEHEHPVRVLPGREGDHFIEWLGDDDPVTLQDLSSVPVNLYPSLVNVAKLVNSGQSIDCHVDPGILCPDL